MNLTKILKVYSFKFQKGLLFALALISIKATAAPIEIWECTEPYAPEDKTLVWATIEEGRQRGEIYVAGVTHKSEFQIQGFDRRWDFGLAKDSTFKYAFVITPNGNARYYDFNSSNKVNMLMHCRETLSKAK